MNQAENAYCVILAGGKGRRLWPCSREQHPKQFIDFFGTGRTLLQQTYDRMRKIFPSNYIYICSNHDYASLVREQLPELPLSNILEEPVQRGTLPCVVWALHRILHEDEDAKVMVVPSDSAIIDEEAFQKNITAGLNFVGRNDDILAFGIKPTRAEPGYGYIQLGDPMEHDVYQVQSFTEKPDRQFAKMFLESGEFYWNTGIFMARARGMIRSISHSLPFILRSFDKEHLEWTIDEETEFIEKNYPTYPNMQLDLTILEKCENVCVMRCSFGWADIGTWHSIYEAYRKSPTDNVVIDSDVMIDDARNNVIRLPKGKIAVVNGLEGYIVADYGNVLMICKKEDSSALVRKYVNEVKMKKGDDYV